jgi:hypothetical protein
MEHHQFSRHIFWDVNFDKLDFDQKVVFVIERVFERGNVTDVWEKRRNYGDNIIKPVLTNAKWPSSQNIYMARAILLDNKLMANRCTILYS